MSAIMLLAFTGCKKEKTFRIGVSQCSQDDWRSKMNAEIRLEAALHDNVEVEILSADDSSEKQIKDIRQFAKEGYDLIMVAPNEAAPLTPVIKEVYDSGIPVIVFDRQVMGDSYTTHIGADNAGLGASAAKYAMTMSGPNSPAIEIYGLRGSSPAEGRHSGFTETYTKEGGRILASESGYWKKENAIPVVDSLLKLYPETKLIFAHNDRMAIGASEVARRLGRNDIRIIGIDAAPHIGIQAVADSIIDATFLYPTDGDNLIQTALKVLKGEKVEKEIVLPSTSAVDRTNAEILLTQNALLEEESGKIVLIKNKMDDYWEAYSTQTTLFYAAILILVLVCVLCFTLLRAYWSRKRHQETLTAQNHLLEQERDKQKELNEKLEEATQSKLMFFTNVSHDLRTPLTLIAEPVAQVSGAKNLTPQQDSLMRLAEKNVKILQRLINQILDFRKYENGKLPLRLKEVNFNMLIKEWVDSFATTARKRDIKLSLSAPQGEEPVTLAIDPEKIERVVFNLLSNAIKFTPANGRIDVRYEVKDWMLRIYVADTGEGIQERDIDHIFDRFYQVDRVNPKGSGIGLSLAKAFVEMHSGKISVTSEVGKGTTFIVEIPVTHASQHTDVSHGNISSEDIESELDSLETELNYDSEKPLVLVVDDNKDILKLVSELISDEYSVITADSGRDALRMAVKYTPDLIISDVMMPGMDGLELTRKLKNEITTSHIPVLLLTACSMDEQRAAGYETGADGYLSKPFNNGVLRTRIANLIANRKRIKDLWQTSSISKPTPTATKKDTTKANKPVASNPDLDNEFYRKFLDIITKEMSNNELSVDSVASRMGLERSQFYRKIKAMTNYSPVELIRRLRLKKGRELLTTTEKSISEIAYDTGFSTPAYFTKCYRDQYGVTPSEERAQLGF